MTRIAIVAALSAALLVGCQTAPPPAPGGRPTIHTISPTQVRPLRWIWITGTNLRGKKMEVYFAGGIRSRNLTTNKEGTKIHVEVPNGAQSGKLVIYVDGVASTPGSVTILPPRKRPPY